MKQLLVLLLLVSCSAKKPPGPGAGPGISPGAVLRPAAAPPPVLLSLETFDPPPIDFALIPDMDWCSIAADPSHSRPHTPHRSWIGNAVCIPEIKTDMAGVPRPNRPPNTLFPGDTGCDIGAYQFVAGGTPPIPPPPTNLRVIEAFTTTLTASPLSIGQGGTITATWVGIETPTEQDWLGLYPVGSPGSAYISWLNTNCSQTVGAVVASGSCPFVLPGGLAPGSYQLRLLADNSYVLLATSNDFSVSP